MQKLSRSPDYGGGLRSDRPSRNGADHFREVHVVCLFADLKDALAFDEYVYSHLMAVPNNEKIFGKQQLYNADDRNHWHHTKSAD